MRSGSHSGVSVLTSCYKSERYLDRFLASLEKQTLFPDFEVLLDLNDPSEEEIRIAEFYSKKYGDLLKVNVTTPVSSLGEAWNKCIRSASGKFLTIWNVDDERNSDSLENQLFAFRANPDAAAVFGPYRVINTVGQKNGRFVENRVSSHEDHLEKFYLGPFFMFKKQVTEQIGYFDEQLKSANDFDFAIRLARSYKILRIDSELGSFLDEGLGSSTKSDSVQPVETVVIQLRYGRFLDVNQLLIPRASNYSVPFMYWDNNWWSVKDFFSDYQYFIDKKLNDFISHNRFRLLAFRINAKFTYLLKKFF